MTGSSTQPFALGTMSRTAAAVAMRKAISLESTAWACVESYVAARQPMTTGTMHAIHEHMRGTDRCGYMRHMRGAVKMWACVPVHR